MTLYPKQRLIKARIPPVVMKNFLYLNLLIFLILVFSALGLHYFLRPRAFPALADAAMDRNRPAGIMVFWEIESVQARRILFEGLPILKRSYNP